MASPSFFEKGTDGYVGSESCIQCHEKEVHDWKKSHHFRSMEVATPKNVLGDFNQQQVHYHGVTTTFYTKTIDGKTEFWVNTDDENGDLKDYKISYSFGFTPLQQYLIEFSGGRLQTLQWCWDTRPKSEGGQRWYHLYENDKVLAGDELHWTGRNFNWNFMCADCHSTHLVKNFDLKTLTYNTQFSELNVSCEACHGPAENHLKWTSELQNELGAASPQELLKKLNAQPRDYNEKEVGFETSLSQKASWTWNNELKKPERSHPLKSHNQTESCARCHSHRNVIRDGFAPPHPFMDDFILTNLKPELYHPDGQIKEEVYVYGSFLQSKMHAKGVVCTDCHNPHTNELKLPMESLCLQCHSAQEYHTPKHHHHAMGSKGAQCVDCHMTGKTFMGVDFRRDHSFRIPRPDLTETTGAPNACNECHQDKTPTWAKEKIQAWAKGKKRPSVIGTPHFANTFANYLALDDQALLDIINNKEQAPIVRSTAIELGSRKAGLEFFKAILPYTQDANSLIKTSALAALSNIPLEVKQASLIKALDDNLLSVRITAAKQLSTHMELPENEKAKLSKATQEMLTSLDVVSDRAAGNFNKAIYFQNRNNPQKAESLYRQAIKVEPLFIPSWINLIQLYNETGDNAQSLKTAKEAITTFPKNSLVWESYARSLIRSKNYPEGVQALQTAVNLDPNRLEVRYFYAIALNSTNQPQKAIQQLVLLVEKAPNNPNYMLQLLNLSLQNKDHSTFQRYIQQAKKNFGHIPEFQYFFR